MRCRRGARSGQHAGGLLSALQQLLVSIGELLSTRIELLALEARQEVLRLMSAAMLLLLTAVFLMFMFACASALLVMVFWESHRLLAVAVLTAVYALLALIAGLALRRALRGEPFAATREELRLDVARLGDADRGRHR